MRTWLRRAAMALSALVGVALIWVAAGAFFYSPEYVYRVLRHGMSDAELYVDWLPVEPIASSSNPYTFEISGDGRAARTAIEATFDVTDVDQFLEDTRTQALIVIKDDVVVYEGYANGADRSTMVTSFSVAKSFTSALVGAAIDRGHVGSVDDPITLYLPELAERDSGFERITIRHLLLMASGFDYQEIRWWLFNGDDPLTTYYPDQREISLTNTNIVEPPGEHFFYNKYHPQLLGMIVERTTGKTVTEFTRDALWEPLGMEYEGQWTLDSVESGFEKMEAGLNARAIDFAKFGRLYLNGGLWEGEQVISSAWVEESTSLDPSLHNPEYYSKSFGSYVFDGGQGYYAYMWYGKLRSEGVPDIIAEGDRGQVIYVSPEHNVIIVRNGLDFGIPLGEWVDGFYELAASV